MTQQPYIRHGGTHHNLVTSGKNVLGEQQVVNNNDDDKHVPLESATIRVRATTGSATSGATTGSVTSNGDGHVGLSWSPATTTMSPAPPLIPSSRLVEPQHQRNLYHSATRGSNLYGNYDLDDTLAVTPAGLWDKLMPQVSAGLDMENNHTSFIAETPWHPGQLNSHSGILNMSAADVPTLTPPELTFNGDSLISVIAYITLFLIAAIGNLTVFIILFRNRRRRSRVNLFIMNLSVADMIVTFVMMPMEIGWHVTVGWQAGDAACRILMFCRVLGFYLSSFVLVVISFDRYFAIAHPLSLVDADRRGKIMLCLAWLLSIVASIPQSIIFHVEVHPVFPWFAQCVTFGFFPTAVHELAYNLFNVLAMYLAPLLVILTTYSLILCEITRKSRENKRNTVRRGSNVPHRAHCMRQSSLGQIEKARIRTLKMTIVIVLVFVMCWTPYFVICAWWWIDAESASRIHSKIQRALFIFAVSNSCVNPIVYGLFTTVIQRELKLAYNWVTHIAVCRRHRPIYIGRLNAINGGSPHRLNKALHQQKSPPRYRYTA